MKNGVNVLYRNVAERFAARVVSELNDTIHTVVLFGSVVRKQAKRDSDIDLLVIGSSLKDRDL